MSAHHELIDIGVNLTARAFRSDREQVIARARAAGITAMIVTGTSVPVSRAALELARSHPGFLLATAGVHPHEARHFEEGTRGELRALAAAPEVVALGECGLDFNRNFSPPALQESCFEAQLELAAELRLPLFLHERDSHERLCALLEPLRAALPRAVVHCFTGGREALERYLELDLHIGITGWICDERRGLNLRELVRAIPLERLMLESDAPYLLPRERHPKPRRGRNEPAFLPHVLERVASCLGRSPAQVAAATSATAREFFALPA